MNNVECVSAMLKCGSCSREAAENSRFCPFCGAPLNADVFATRTVASAVHRTSPTSAPSESPATGSHRAFVPGALLAGRYRIVALLGKGGMGEVYRADDLTLGQQCALKFLPESIAKNPDALERFRNEVRVARQVSHPNVCRVYDLGEFDGRWFLSMEYIDGEDLGSLARRIGRLPSDKALEIARKLCAGLAAAHEKGVLHRDLKPANVMLDSRGQILLTDFGLAGLAGQFQGAEVRNGTPAYMAPEQLCGREVTPRSDIYSLGLVLYEIFTGKRPFEADTLAGLVRAQQEATPVSITTLVPDLDSSVERAILRCLQPDPARRPSSALAVAAGLPGGDPLAAALAAGETPSPQLVAAAGEGTGLAPRVAVPVFIAIIVGLLVLSTLAVRLSALERTNPAFSPEVLSLKAQEIIHSLTYTDEPVDTARGFSWEESYVNYAQNEDKPFPRWDDILSQRPSLLRFWYRQSVYPLSGTEFHDDRLTPGIVTASDPPPVFSGMINLTLDAQGRLLDFEAIPPQLLAPTRQPESRNVASDWNKLFEAAALDPAQLQPVEPLWTFLAASDTRMAWMGTWPGTARPLRVEAASLRGRPVAFALLGPWNQPERMPPPQSLTGELIASIAISFLALILCVGAPWLARRNVKQAKGDRRGAFRLACFIIAVEMAVWLCRGHFALTIGTAGDFFVAVCTSVFYGAVIWTLYLALEPFVRRRWPQSIISWSVVLSGRTRDPIVGRDVLIGIAIGISFGLIGQVGDLFSLGSHAIPVRLDPTDILLGVRGAIAAWLIHVPGAVRATLGYFFLLFLFRAILRNQWIAGTVFAFIFPVLTAVQSDHPWIDGTESLLIYAIVATAILRFGLLPLAVGVFFGGLWRSVPITTHASAWYFSSSVFMLAVVVLLAAWAFYTSMEGRRLWKQDLFE